MSTLNLTQEKILYGQNGDLWIGDSSGFTKVDASALSPNKSYHTGNEVSICSAGGYFWIVDGQNLLRRVKVDTGVITQPAPTAGSIPFFGTSSIKYGRLLALYRDRLFHGRFVESPYNLIASKSGSYLDYDVSDLTQKGAFELNATDQAGQVGDIITALIPYGDVSMVIGMHGQIAVMRGDPKAGGSIDHLSREVGIVSPKAWCRDPDGRLYFMARDGLYAMSPTQAPQPLSDGRLDETLGQVDHDAVRISMEWDPLEQGVKIYLIDAGSSGTMTSVFWDQRKDAFWADCCSRTVGPTATASLRGTAGTLPGVLLGGRDGQLRILDAESKNDDGATIYSRVKYAPAQPLGAFVNLKVLQTRLLWGDDDGDDFNVTYSLYSADDPVSALELVSPGYSKTITTGGYQSLDRERSRGSCFVFELYNGEYDKSWAIERGEILYAPTGRVRA